MFQKIFKASIFTLVFLMPLFWLPFSLEAYGFNKSYLLFFLVSLAFLSWLGNMIFKEKKIKFRRSPLDYFVFGFLAVIILTTVFSKDKISSLLGFYGRFWPSLFGVLSMGAFYFLLTNNVTTSGEVKGGSEIKIRSLFTTLFWSAFLVVLFTCFSLFGVWVRLGKFFKVQIPELMSLNSFNTVGSLQELSLFLATVAALLVTLLAFREKEVALKKEEKEAKEEKGPVKKEKRAMWAIVGLYFLLIAILGLMVVIDFWQAWLCLAIALFLFLALSFWKRVFKEDVNRLSVPIFILLIALIFLFPSPFKNFLQQLPIAKDLPRELLLPQGVNWSVGLQGLKESPVLGSGLGTFHYLFSKFKPASFLQTQFWQIRFDRSSSHIAETLGTTGVLGFLSYLAMVGIFILISYFYISSYRPKKFGTGLSQNKETVQEEKNKDVVLSSQDQERRLLVIPLLTTFVVLLTSQFFYYQTNVLAFSFWLVLGLGVVSWGKVYKERLYSFKEFPEVGLVLSVFFWVLVIGFCFSYFSLGKYYLADINFKDYSEDPNKNLASLERATRLGNLITTYHIRLAGVYLQKFLDEAAKPQPDLQVAANMVALSVDQARKAVERGENRVAAQETAGAVYREIQGVAEGALEWGLKSFEKALALEPKNPVLLTELGKLRVINNEKEQAKKLFEEAIGLRPDYIDATLRLSLLEEAEGKVKEAQSRLESLVQQAPLIQQIPFQIPFLAEAHFQLGRIYYKDKEYEKATQAFQQVLALFPNHSNSLYLLGFIYEIEGKKEKALEMFNKVLELNPGNKEVQDKIQSLKTPPQPTEPPREEEEEKEKK